MATGKRIIGRVGVRATFDGRVTLRRGATDAINFPSLVRFGVDENGSTFEVGIGCWCELVASVVDSWLLTASSLVFLAAFLFFLLVN